MHVPRECYQIEQQLVAMCPTLRPAQRRTLALWVAGTILGGSATQQAVIGALAECGHWHTIRDRLREWLYDGKDRAAPCHTQLDVSACFAPLLRWILARWQSDHLALAIDATYLHDQLTVLAIAIVYRGAAIPVAWHLTRCNEPGAWTPILLKLLDQLAPAIPSSMRVMVLCDRGLRILDLWRDLQRRTWHPMIRQRSDLTVRPAGYRNRVAARSLVPQPGSAWVGAGTACEHAPYRRPATVIVIWVEGVADPWILLTTLPPETTGVWWYSLRVWIELGFRVLKGVGWQWQRTRRTDPDRASRHWLVLAVVSAWVMAYGTRVEEQQRAERGWPTPPSPKRLASLVCLGLPALRKRVARAQLWRRLVYRPDPWPDPPDDLCVTRHQGMPP